MAKIKSLDELMKIKEKAVKEIQMRDTEKKGKIIVAMGTCGIAAGAKETLQAVVNELEKNGINDVSVVQSGCMGLCDVEPTVEVIMEGSDPIIYGHVSPEQVTRIVDQHVKNGKVVSDLLVRKGEI
ncbi:MAG TPA: (2Fe-2S) ferredoxin domain-containing protein [Thermotogota bacterium]|nr:(2Fe-2S) ferredoxin domain-containing protein [Thermotogota bacterium]HRW33463.1 (2Fe-2S) ferredoxin domain-containing protein [Thermotogota bacterium]